MKKDRRIKRKKERRDNERGSGEKRKRWLGDGEE
jgi:hypothetical protein